MHLPAEAQSAKAGQVTGTVESHLAAAKKAAGTQFTALQERVCESALPAPAPAPAGRGGGGGGRQAGPPPASQWHAEPAKVFDNLYFVGMTEYSAWALTTSQGIIVIDTIYDYSVEDEVVNGLKKLGLNPARHQVRARQPRAHRSHRRRQVPAGSLRHARRHVEGGLGPARTARSRTDSPEARHRGEGRRQADARRHHHHDVPHAGSYAGHDLEHLPGQGSRDAAHGRDVGRHGDPASRRSRRTFLAVHRIGGALSAIVKKSGADIILSNHTAYDNTNANIAALRDAQAERAQSVRRRQRRDPPLHHHRRGMREGGFPCHQRACRDEQPLSKICDW